MRVSPIYHRQCYFKTRPIALLAFYLYPAMMTFHNPVNNGKAKTCAEIHCCKEWVKYPVYILCVNAAACIRNGNLNKFRGQGSGFGGQPLTPDFLPPDLQSSSIRHYMPRIQKEI